MSTESRNGVPPRLARYGLSAWYLIGILLLISAVVFATSRIQIVFIAIFLGLVVTALLNPLVNALSHHMRRGCATFIALLGAFAFIGALLTYVVVSVSDEWDSLGSQFSTGVDQVFDFLENGPLPWSFTRPDVTDAIQNALSTGLAFIQSHAGSVASQAMSSASTLILVFTVLALAFFSSIFFLMSGGKMWLWFLNQLPHRKRERTHEAASAGWSTFSGYARGTIIIAVSDGILVAIFLLILGIPLAAPLAILVMIGAVVPLIGAPTAMLIAMIVALAADGFIKAAIVGIGIAAIGQFEGHVLQPLVMGRQVSLHPVVVAVGVAAGTMAAGLLGAVIAIPLIAVTWEVFKTVRHVDPPLEALPGAVAEVSSGSEDSGEA